MHIGLDADRFGLMHAAAQTVCAAQPERERAGRFVKRVGIVGRFFELCAAAERGYGGGTIDSARSQALSDYLHQHHLPLVKAQVVTDSSGGQEIILFGFVASDFGRADADKKARTYMKNRSLVVDNRIVVSPSLASNGDPSAGTNPSAPDNSDPYGAPGSAQDYQNQPGVDAYTAQQYGQYGSSSPDPMMQIMTQFSRMLMSGGASFGGGYGGGYGSGSGGYGPGYGGYGGYPAYPPSGYGGYPSP